MKITVLVNDDADNFPCEHGLSLIVQTFDKRFIVDFGASSLFYTNARRLDESLVVDFAVVSHNHNDHNGGAKAFLEQFPETKLFLGKENRMTYGGICFPHYKLGMEKDFFKRYEKNITFVDDIVKLDNVYIINIPYNKSEVQGKYQYILKGGLLFKDVYKHEITVCVLENSVLNIISPCSHKGVNHIINECKKRFPEVKTVNFFGGLHTKGRNEKPLNCPLERVFHIAEELQKQGVNRLVLGHCTGQKAVEILKEKGLSVEEICGGKVYEL